MIKRKPNILVRVSGVLLAAATVAMAQVPQMIYYQGKVSTLAGTPFSGPGQFKFALVDAAGARYWSHDGTWVVPPAGGTPEPANPVPLTVNNGVYSVLLGNITLPGMTVALPPGIFANPVVYLRIWFSDGGPFNLMTPDIRIASVGYAMIAHTVVDGTITEPKLGDGAVTASKLANDAITSIAVTDGAITTAKLADYAITADKLATDSVTSRELRDNSVSGNELVDHIQLGDRSNDGQLEIWSGTSATDPEITLNGADGKITTLGNIISYDGFSVAGEYSGSLGLPDKLLAKLDSSGGGGHLKLYTEDSGTGVEVWGTGADGGGVIRVNTGGGGVGVYIRGDWDGAGFLRVDGTNGTVIQLDGHDADGKGRITTQVLEITGGSDLSETFNVTAPSDTPQPGMILSIDSHSPGQLLVSSTAYDRAVAGVVSGAGGVNPGMLMGQHGTPASGKYPVALTGRVYCQADTSNGPIEPGDLLTTSNRRGHAMKVTDHARAQGAIIGKAMSPLSEGTGLVLVLVSLQ